jgi:hypothetical protein
MRIYTEGEASKGLCEVCKKLVPTTFKVSSVKLSSKKGRVDGILVAKCDYCNHTVSIPQQSSPRIKEVLNTKKYSIEVRLPIHLLDILILATDQFEMGSPEQLKDSIVRYYIALADKDKAISKQIKKFSESDFAKGSGYRLSLKVNQAVYECFHHLMEQTKLNKTQLLKGLILQINEDILQKPQKKIMNDLEKVMFASA